MFSITKITIHNSSNNIFWSLIASKDKNIFTRNFNEIFCEIFSEWIYKLSHYNREAPIINTTNSLLSVDHQIAKVSIKFSPIETIK